MSGDWGVIKCVQGAQTGQPGGRIGRPMTVDLRRCMMRGKHLAFDKSQFQKEMKRAIRASGEHGLGLKWRVGAGSVAALLFLALLVCLPMQARAAGNAGGQVSVGISVSFGPPPLPVYAQPVCPGPGYIWAPGYWAWDPANGYYWVPGTWVQAPYPGALWTPGYWGWSPVVFGFVWHAGYWGPRVGFYGGIDYGFGYYGHGYDGGYWRHGRFFYNRAVNHLDFRYIHHFYDRDQFHHHRWGRISYNGGRGGIVARPTRYDRDARRARRMGPMQQQYRQERMARRIPDSRWSVNRGRPRIAATRRPARFTGNGVMRATRSGGPYPVRQRRGFTSGNGPWHTFGGQPNGRRGYARQGNRGGQQHGFRPVRNNHRQQRPQQQQGQSFRGQRGNSQRGFRSFQQRPNQSRQQRGMRQQQRGMRQQQRGFQQRQNQQRQQRQMRPQQQRRVYGAPGRQRRSYSRQSSGNRQRQMRQQRSSRGRGGNQGHSNNGHGKHGHGNSHDHGNPHSHGHR